MFQIQKPDIHLLDSISEEKLSQNVENVLIPNKTWTVNPEDFFKSVSLASSLPTLASYHFVLSVFKNELSIQFDNYEIQLHALLPLKREGFSEEELDDSVFYLCELTQFTILSNPKIPFRFQFEGKDIFFSDENLKHKIEAYPSQRPIQSLPSPLSYSDFKIKNYLKSLLSLFSLSPSLSEDIVEIKEGAIYLNCTIFTVKILDLSLFPPHSIVLKSFYLKSLLRMGEGIKVASKKDRIYLKESYYTLSLPRLKRKVDIHFIPNSTVLFTFQLDLNPLLKAFKTATAFKSQTFGFDIEGSNLYLRISSKTEFILPVVFQGKPGFIKDLPTPLFSRILAALPKDKSICFYVTKTYIEVQVPPYTIRISRFIV